MFWLLPNVGSDYQRIDCAETYKGQDGFETAHYSPTSMLAT